VPTTTELLLRPLRIDRGVLARAEHRPIFAPAGVNEPGFCTYRPGGRSPPAWSRDVFQKVIIASPSYLSWVPPLG
jgi:hypothetical protein